MSIQTKTIGRMPTDHGPYDPQLAYGKKFQCTLFGCAWESLHDNNNTAPAVWDGGDVITPNLVDWKKQSGSYESWLMNRDKPASTGTTGDYPYNGMGRITIPKNIQVDTSVEPSVTTNILDPALFNKANTVYVIKYDFVLGGNITMPANCVLEFDGGSVSGDGSNDTITGQNTMLRYYNPFINNVLLSGSFVSETIVRDSEIFVDSNYGNRRIQSMFCIHGSDEKLVFDKNTYNDVDTVNLSRNVDVDFSGSTLNMKLDSYDIPVTFISTPVKSVSDSSYLDFFKLRNVTIIGNEEYQYNGHLVPPTTHSGPRRNNIMLFKVDTIEIDSVNFYHIEVGTDAWIKPDLRSDYYAHVVSVFYYNKAKINNSRLHDCGGDNLFAFAPNVNKDNMAVVSNCYSYRNYTGLVALYDGRCEIFGNKIHDFGMDAINCFGYESNIYNNYFADQVVFGREVEPDNQIPTLCVDTTEQGTFRARDIKVYNNIAENVYGFMQALGDNIHIFNNNVKINYDWALNRLLTITPRSVSFADQSFLNIPATSIDKVSYYVYNNIVKGGGLIGFYNVISTQHPTVENGDIIDYIYAEGNYCEKVTEALYKYSHTIDIVNTKKCIIKNNYFKGLSRVGAGQYNLTFWELFVPSYNGSTIFNTDIEFIDNTFEYLAHSDNNHDYKIGYIGAQATSSNFGVKVIFVNNKLINAPQALEDIIGYGEGNLSSLSLYSDNNNISIKESSIDHLHIVGQCNIVNGLPRYWDGTNWVDATGNHLT